MTPAIIMVVAAAAPVPAVHALDVPAFRFSTGETQPVRLGYRTFGQPIRNAEGAVVNAVLLLHGTSASGTQFLTAPFQRWFAAGGPLDAARVFTIIPDAIGFDLSSKPSDIPARAFPAYGYADMVAGQARVLEALGVKRLRLTIGTSMGGMHAWLWATRRPEQAGAVLALAALPQKPAGLNALWRVASAQALRADPRPGGTGVRTATAISLMAMAAPRTLQAAAPDRAGAERLIESFVARGEGQPIDLAYRIAASRDYDPAEQLDRVVGPVLNVNFADDPLYPPTLDPMPGVTARYSTIRSIIVPRRFTDQRPWHAGRSRALAGRSRSLHPLRARARLLVLNPKR